MIYTFAHTKGGVGKSMLAWHTAIAIGAPLVDLDFQKTLVFANSIREQAGLKPLDIVHINSEDHFIEMFEAWPDEKDIIIDVGGFDLSINRIALLISDVIITPASDQVTEIAGLSKYHEIISDISEKIQGADIKANVLLNNVSPNAKDFSVIEDLVEDFERYEMMKSVIPRLADYSNALKEGKGVTELGKVKDKNGKMVNRRAVKELKKLIKEIRSIAKEL